MAGVNPQDPRWPAYQSELSRRADYHFSGDYTPVEQAVNVIRAYGERKGLIHPEPQKQSFSSHTRWYSLNPFRRR